MRIYYQSEMCFIFADLFLEANYVLAGWCRMVFVCVVYSNHQLCTICLPYIISSESSNSPEMEVTICVAPVKQYQRVITEIHVPDFSKKNLPQRHKRLFDLDYRIQMIKLE